MVDISQAVAYVASAPLPRDGRFDFLSHGSANIPGDTLNRPRLTARNVEYAACRRRLLQRLGKRPRNVAHLNDIALLPPDRKRAGRGKSVSVCVDCVGRRDINKKKKI